ncbi:glycoside hydrolase family 15 protein [Thermoleophilum album]|uniref:Trehalase n=1 Tax=Thermoleophilum album TaxID=29539 RepID=A0A1H6FUH6_THEAL|nr:glycoside hydrolase family 15 protein [Thermoleophilum album]SEH13818.1 Glucoamylase (glucan-1,4-alpha-glucosidase), GH15 family [Thermoleophilum album]
MSVAPTTPRFGQERVCPIADYAFLSDCEAGALIAPDGSVDWLCLPRFDSPSVFAKVLDPDAGFFRVGPAETSVPVDRRYVPGTMVLETSWGTRSGWVIVRDCLLVGPWQAERPEQSGWRRAPVDRAARHVLLRTLRCVHGEVEIAVECEPRFDYGRLASHWEFTEGGYHELVARPTEPCDGARELRLRSDIRIGVEGGRATARTTLREGDLRFVALGWDAWLPEDYDEAYRTLVETAHHWQHWLDAGRFPDHPWRAVLQRSALTLRAMAYAPTGAIIAAPTTSLPEAPGGSRNWDYRYCWLRDSAFALWALHSLGFDREADDFFFFLADVLGGGAVQVVYGIGGERELEERTLDHLRGYADSRPVRIGNAAYKQRQNDVWGALLDAVYLHVRGREQLSVDVWPNVREVVEEALRRWREPDRGIWEVRGPERHFVSSKVMCWVAAERGARLAAYRGEHELERRWLAAAQEIRAEILRHGCDERGVFTQAFGSRELDASALLIPLVRFLPPDDERVRKTVAAIEEELSEGGMVLRYRPERADDGIGEPEGTFTICSFWLVSALVELGELERAGELCERLLAHAGPLGLYAEELDPRSGRHLGNYPQALTHLALINAVLHVARAELGLDATSLPFGRPWPEVA